MRRFASDRLVLASHNAGKLREIISLLDPYDILVTSAGELGLEEPEETGTTFAENARIKAHAAAQASDLPALSDDSGICVAALGGAPGVYTADWAKTETGRDFGMAMTRVWNELKETKVPQPYQAHFHCTLCLTWPDGHDEIFDGIAPGTLTWPKRGTNGFGFDPMFVPSGHEMTFGEMTPSQKEPLTHRARAWEKLVAACLA